MKIRLPAGMGLATKTDSGWKHEHGTESGLVRTMSDEDGAKLIAKAGASEVGKQTPRAKPQVEDARPPETA